MNYRSRADTAPKKSAVVRNPPSYGYKPSWNKPRSMSPSQNIPSHHQVPVDSRAAKGSIHNASQGPIIQKKERPHGELLVMTIDLGDGTKDLLRVFEGDDPFHLARVFCERHQLNIQLVEPLAQNIYGNMEQVLQESVHTLNLVAPGHENDQLPEMQSIEGQDTGKFRGIAEAASHFGGSNYENQEEEEQQYAGRNYNDYAQIERYNAQINEHERRDMHMRGRDGERLSSQNQHPQTRGSTQSRKYDDEAEMYEMIDHDDNGELIAERVNPKNMGGALRNGLTEKDLTMSKGRRDEYQESQKSKMASPQQYEQRGNHMQFGSAEQGRLRGNSDYQSESKPGKSWTSGEEFQNEEEYLDYLVNSQYGVGKEKQPGKYDLTFVPHINQQSKQMLENKGQLKGNVYERLHDESKIKNSQHSQQNVLRQSHSAQKTNSSTIKSQAGLDINYGTLLYHRGVKKSEDTKKQLIERRKEKIEKLSKECTFKPELNKISQQIMSTKARYENTEDKLIRSGKDAKDKLERARSAKKAKEVEECTFHPEINFISQRIDSEKSKMAQQLGHDRYSKLYSESRMRQDHQQVVSQMAPPECTFKPMINNYHGSAIGQTTFEQRDQKFRDRMERINYMRQLKEEAEVRDPETGEPLFRPKTGRSPIGRNSGNLPIGDYLYIQQYKIAENKRRLHENHERSVKANMARSSENSHIIVENLMRRRLEDIFRRFDSDGDGCISSAKIDITGVGNDVLETLAPILCEMEERNQILDFEAFCEQIDRLFRFLTVAEKDKLLLGKKESPQESLWTFQPEIDKRSERIAQRKHPYGDFHSLYGSYIDERKKLNQKIQDQQEKNSQDQLKECSFKPRLYTSPKSSSLLSSTKGYPRGPGNNYFMDDLLI